MQTHTRVKFKLVFFKHSFNTYFKSHKPKSIHIASMKALICLSEVSDEKVETFINLESLINYDY